MKLRLKTFLSALLACSSLVQAESTIVWANGVSAEGGWYDVNKQNPDAHDGDDNMCYAASAANLIAWWQDSLTSVPIGTPTNADDIWAKYKAASQSDGEKGGDAGWSVIWWISGVYTPTTREEANRWVDSNITLSLSSELKAFDGYYYDSCSLTSNEVANFGGAYVENNTWITSYTLSGDSISGGLFENKTFGDVLSAGYGVSLGLKQDNKDSYGHAITLWGAEYNSEGALTKLWLTDSDDQQYGMNKDGLFAADVEIENGKIYISTQKEQWQEGNTIYSGTWYEKEERTYIGSVHLLNPAAFSVPEPATATLSLLALAGLVARRRRK